MTSWLALARFGWRNAGLAKWRSALVVALIALPIAGVVAAATAVQMAIPARSDDVRGYFGSADVIVESLGENDSLALTRPALNAALPDGARAVAVRFEAAKTAELYDSIFLTDVPLDDPMVEGRYTLFAGRLPERPGEIAPSGWIMDRNSLEIGDLLALTEPERELLIVGVMIRNEDLNSRRAVVAEQTIPGPATYWVDLGDSDIEDLRDGLAAQGYSEFVDDSGVSIDGSPDVDGRYVQLQDRSARSEVVARDDAAAAAVLAGGVLAVAAAGLIASAAFTVSSRRRRRELGLLGAVGGNGNHLRRSVMLEGVAVGVVGSGLGAAIGIVVVAINRDRLEDIASRLIGPVDPSPLILSSAMVLGTAAAAFAAWLPARAAARSSVVDSLSARRAEQPPRGRMAAIGVAVSVGGLALVALGAAANASAILLTGGVVAFAGVLLGAPVVIELFSTAARWFPIAVRIGIRDLARNRTRSAATLAAILVVLTLPVALVSAVRSEYIFAIDSYTPGLGPNQIAFRQLTESSEWAVPFSDVAEAPVNIPLLDIGRQVRDQVGGVIASGEFRPLYARAGADDPVYAVGSSQRLAGRFADPETADDPHRSQLYVADRNLLVALGIEAMAEELNQGAVIGIVTGSTSDGTVQIQNLEGSGSVTVAAVEAGLVFRYQLPGFLISERRASELGLTIGPPEGLIMLLDHPPTDAEFNTARRIATPSNIVVFTESGVDPPVLPEPLVLGISGAVALAIVAVIVSLSAAEGQRERTLLAAVGAPPAVRRLAGATGAAALALLAGTLATVLGVGLIGAHQLWREDPQWAGAPEYTAQIPVNATVFAIVAVPAAAFVVAWLLAGSGGSPRGGLL